MWNLLISLIDDKECGETAIEALSKLLVFDAFNDIAELSKTSKNALKILTSWANADWFTSKPEVPKKIDTIIFKVPGETNTDDLSPAPDVGQDQIFPYMLWQCIKCQEKDYLKNLLKKLIS